jgi:DNA-directed RNA polymerase specialized sigma24 family protein
MFLEVTLEHLRQCIILKKDIGGYEIVIAPLKKHRRDGRLYTRPPQIEAKIIELLSLSRCELITQCEIRQRTDPGYVPSECLLHFIRASRTDKSDIYFKRLYKILVERVLRCLPKAESLNGKTTSLIKSNIREKVFGHFVDLLASDRNAYLDKLDYYEINFNAALKKLRLSAQAQAWRDENRVTILYDEDTGEPTAAVERATGSFDPFNMSAYADDNYRSLLNAAIDALPLEQRRIVVMIQQGIPIDSKDPNVITIAKTLGKSEKTIRTHRDKAYAALRTALTMGETV